MGACACVSARDQLEGVMSPWSIGIVMSYNFRLMATTEAALLQEKVETSPLQLFFKDGNIKILTLNIQFRNSVLRLLNYRCQSNLE